MTACYRSANTRAAPVYDSTASTRSGENGTRRMRAPVTFDNHPALVARDAEGAVINGRAHALNAYAPGILGFPSDLDLGLQRQPQAAALL